MLFDGNIFEAVSAGASKDNLDSTVHIAKPESNLVNGLTVFSKLPFSESLLWGLKAYYPYNYIFLGKKYLKMKLNKSGASSFDAGSSYYLPNNCEIYFKARKALDKASIEIPGSRFNIAKWNHISFENQADKDYRDQLIIPLPNIKLETNDQLECWIHFPEVGTAGTNYPSYNGSTGQFTLSTTYSYFSIMYEVEKV